MLLLDTEILIDYQREYPPCIEWMKTVGEQLMIPGFVGLELINSARNKKELKDSVGVARKFDSVWPTAEDMMNAMDDYISIHLSNGIGIIDALIVATAVGFKSTLVTYNLKHFKVYPKLVTLQPY